MGREFCTARDVKPCLLVAISDQVNLPGQCPLVQEIAEISSFRCDAERPLRRYVSFAIPERKNLTRPDIVSY
jgi:hypothetical protein